MSGFADLAMGNGIKASLRTDPHHNPHKNDDVTTECVSGRVCRELCDLTAPEQGGSKNWGL